MSSQDLQQAFDGESDAQDVANHVATCTPCNSALEVLQTQRDAVHYLSEPTGEQSPQSAVEHILTQSARAGREKLADLLYEMAKACLIVVPDFKRRVERRVEPRDAPVVSGELRSINSRLDDADAANDVTPLPQTTPEENRALSVARSCLTILENVEGESERGSLARSQLLMFEGNPSEAEELMDRLLATSVSSENRVLAQRNKMLASIRQEHYREAIKYGESVRRDGNDDPAILFNLAVSNAWLRDVSGFELAATGVGTLLSSGQHSWLSELVSYELPRFAQVLGLDEIEIQRAFGIGLTGSEEALS
jgi:hypothetical protein